MIERLWFKSRLLDGYFITFIHWMIVALLEETKNKPKEAVEVHIELSRAEQRNAKQSREAKRTEKSRQATRRQDKIKKRREEMR